VATVEPAQLEAALGGGLLDLACSARQRVSVRGGAEHDAGERHLGVAGREFRVALVDGSAGAALPRADTKPGPPALLFVGGETNCVALDASQ
jgi:hypothetical protein